MTDAEPDFHLQLVGGHIFQPPLEGLTGLALFARIWNAGADSIVPAWRLAVAAPNRNVVEAQFTTPPETLTLTGTPSTVLSPSDLGLARATSIAPLRRGDAPMESGLLFYARLPRHEILQAETILTLTALDVDGKPHSTVQRIEDWLSAGATT